MKPRSPELRDLQSQLADLDARIATDEAALNELKRQRADVFYRQLSLQQQSQHQARAADESKRRKAMADRKSKIIAKQIAPIDDRIRQLESDLKRHVANRNQNRIGDVQLRIEKLKQRRQQLLAA